MPDPDTNISCSAHNLAEFPAAGSIAASVVRQHAAEQCRVSDRCRIRAELPVSSQSSLI